VEKIDFTQLITKQVVSSDKKLVGRVDGLDDTYLIVKDGLFNPSYYKIPREKVNRYQEGKVLLDTSEQEVEKLFKRKFPGYFRNDSD
jgi:hypothetical protein